MGKKKKTIKVLKNVKQDLLMDNFGKKNIENLRNSKAFTEDKHFTMIEASTGCSNVTPNLNNLSKTTKNKNNMVINMFMDNNFFGNNTDIIEITSSDTVSLLLERSGIDGIKVHLPFSFDIGNLKEMEEFKRNELNKFIPNGEKNFDFKELFNKLKEYVSKAKIIRVWSSMFDADEYCMLLFICHHFKDKEISVVFASEGNIWSWVIPNNSQEEIKELEKKEHILKQYEKEDLGKEWEKIILSNKELRFMINGSVISVDLDYFDNDIIDRLKSLGKVSKTKLVVSLMGDPIIPRCHYADFIWEFFINDLINKGLIKSTFEDNKEMVEVK